MTTSLDAKIGELVKLRSLPVELAEIAKRKIIAKQFDGPIDTFSVKRRGLVDEALHNCGQQGDARGLVATSLKAMDPAEDIWLVAHKWSFAFREALEQLRADDALRTSLSAVIFRDETVVQSPECIFENLWRIATPISAKNQRGDTLWIVHDELGSALSHSTTPIARLATIVFDDGVVSLLWLTETCQSGSVITIDRSPAVLAHNDVSDGAIGRILYGDTNEIAEGLRLCEMHLNKRDSRVSAAPLVDLAMQIPTAPVYEMWAGKKPLKVCTDSRLVQESLTDRKHFTIVSDAEDADVMWLCHYHMRTVDEFPFARFVSQLPEERFFVNKGALARTIQRGYGYRTWHPDTYECPEQLPAFIAAFERRQKRVDTGTKDGDGVDDEVEEHNLWIVKAPELTRGIDMCISGNLQWLIRLGSECGQRILQVYISRPLLFRSRKFDVRYYLMIRSAMPLEAYVYKTFVVRLAGEEYQPTELHRFDRHWTVSRETGQGTFVNEDFIQEFERDRAAERGGPPGDVWRQEVEPRVFKMLHELCLAIHSTVTMTTARERFRGLYAIDVLFTSKGLQPRLLEVNYSPDNTKILSIAPNFTNDVFSTLFLGRPMNSMKL